MQTKLERSIEEIIHNLLQGAESYFTYNNQTYWVSKIENNNFCFVADTEGAMPQSFYSLSDLINYGELEGEAFLDVFNEIEFDLGGMFVRDKYAHDRLAYIDINIKKIKEILEAYKTVRIKSGEFSAMIAKKETDIFFLTQLLPINCFKRYQFSSISEMFNKFNIGGQSLLEIWDGIIIEEII
ncbi:MAG: hypothetical protein ACRC6X_05085 [Culicoidibacterales bacterium]